MTPEQQNIAIAESCGFTNCHVEEGEAFGFEHGVMPDNEDPYLALNATWVPDYCNDLNAMHKAEKVLYDSQKTIYARNWLVLVAGSHLMPFATAAQRAEAFLRTLNLWTD